MSKRLEGGMGHGLKTMLRHSWKERKAPGGHDTDEAGGRSCEDQCIVDKGKRLKIVVKIVSLPTCCVSDLASA